MYTRLVYSTIWILLLQGMSSCSENKDLQIQRITHNSGFSLALPKHLNSEQTPTGFLVYPQGGRDRRSPIEVTITFYTQGIPSGQWADSKVVNEKTVYYKMTSSSGGSGGDEYQMMAWFAHQSGYVLFEQYLQVEPPAKPDFELFWQVIRAAS